jgi:Ca2+-binding EF-hand superfamily protein
MTTPLLRVRISYEVRGKRDEPPLASLSVPMVVPVTWYHKPMLHLKMWFVKNWNTKFPSHYLDVRQSFFIDSAGIQIFDADPISHGVSDNCLIHLETGGETLTTIIPKSKLCGVLASTNTEARRRAHEVKKEQVLKKLFEPPPAIDYEARCRNYFAHDITPFELAGIGATDRMFELIRTKRLDINGRDKTGRTCLYIATLFDHYNTAYELLEHGADANVPDEEGWAPLSVACRYGHVSVLVLLLDHGADRSWRSRDGTWKNDHLRVHVNACKDAHRRDQVYAIVRGHRIAESWLEIIDAHWDSVGGRPDYDKMLANTTEYLKEYAEKIEREEALEAERAGGEEGAASRPMKETNSAMDVLAPWNCTPETPQQRQSTLLLRQIFELLDDQNSEAITKDQLFDGLRENKDVILTLTKFSSLKTMLRVELYEDVFDNLVTATPGVLTFEEFLKFIEYGETQSSNRLILRRLFDAIDTDGNNSVEKTELLYAFRRNPDVVAILTRKPSLAILLKPKLFQEAFLQMDTDLTGTVSFEEFVRFVEVSQSTAEQRLRLRRIFDEVDREGKDTITKRALLKAFTCNDRVIKLVSDEPLMRILLVPRLWEKAFLSIVPPPKRPDSVEKSKRDRRRKGGEGGRVKPDGDNGARAVELPALPGPSSPSGQALITFEQFASFVLHQQVSKVNPVLLEYLFQSLSQLHDEECTRRQMFRSLTRDKNIFKILNDTGPLRRLVRGSEVSEAFKGMSKKRGYFTLRDFLMYAKQSKQKYRQEILQRSIFKQTVNDIDSEEENIISPEEMERERLRIEKEVAIREFKKGQEKKLEEEAYEKAQRKKLGLESEDE